MTSKTSPGRTPLGISFEDGTRRLLGDPIEVVGRRKGPARRRDTQLSLNDLEIPVKRLLTAEEESCYGQRIQASLARLRALIPQTAAGARLYLQQMERVSVGHQVVVAWFPLRDGIEDDIAAASRHLERARSLAAKSRRTRREEESIARQLRRVEKILRRYPIDPETLLAWAREIAAPSEHDDPLATRERDARIAGLIARVASVVEETRDRLVLPNLRLVLKDVFRFNPTGMRRSDLFQEGILGLHRAVFRYDPTRKTRFSTYATYWIRQSIRKALIDRSRLIRVPQAVQEELRNPESRIDPGEADRVRRVMNETVSMSAGEETDPRDQLSFEAVQDSSHDEEMHLGVVPRAVERALSALNGREREVVRRRFGIGGDRVQTLEEIGVALHLSRERIRQIEREALEKMRKGSELQAVYEDLN